MKKSTTQKSGDLLLVLACALLAVLLLSASKTVGEGVRQGLWLCGNVVIPSLFPFMVLSGFVASSRASAMLGRLLRPVTRHVFRLPPAAASPLLMGMIGGYPVGARTLAVMVGQHRLSEKTAGRMLCFCANAGPPFLLSAVGLGMFGSLKLGGLLLAAQAASALLIGFVMGRFSGKAGEEEPSMQGYRPYSVCFVQAVNDACTGMFSICAFVVLFSALTSLLASTGVAEMLARVLGQWFSSLEPALMEGILYGVLEVTTGCSALGRCGYYGLLAAAFLLSLSGLSVVFQVLAATHGSGIPVRGFLLSRIAHAALTLCLFLGLLRLFPQALEVALSLSHPVQASAGTASGSASLIAMCAVFLLTLNRKPGRQAGNL